MSFVTNPRFKILLNEALHHRRMVVQAFVAINLIALLAAVAWPKGYVASTTILVSDRSIIQPLMQGAAATTGVTDRARIAREIINGHKVMDQVIEMAGWVKPGMSQKDKERIVDALNKQITISNVGSNLIKIEYKNTDPRAAFRTTQALADIFIKESIEAKADESRSAFEFIDQQTQEYHAKLVKMEDALKEFRIANIDASPGSEGDVNSRLNSLQTQIDQTAQQLREAEIKKRSLERQLSGEAETAMVLTREGQYRARLGELQTQLETLRLSYHDTYPDIVRIRHQIDDLNQAIAAERNRRKSAGTSGAPVLDEAVINNPMYQQLKRDLSQTQVQIDMLSARLAEEKKQVGNVVEQGKRVTGGDATLAELTRDYQVNRDIYQDLLKRRESARVSMNMDKENQGLTFKIQEPAVLPTKPSGLRFGHFVLIGLSLGVALPFALIYYAKIELDPRVRSPALLVKQYRLPMMVVVPHFSSGSEMIGIRRDLADLGTAIIATLGLILLVSSLAFAGIV